MTASLLVGTAVTRPGSIGTLFRFENGAWSPVAGVPLDTGVQALTPHPRQAGTIFAATRSGVYKSTDHGKRWEKLDVPSNKEEFWSIAIHPRDPHVLFAGTAPVGVYRSDDGGASWRRVGSKEPFPEICDYSKAPKGLTSRLMRICFDPTNPNLMFGACETNGLIVSEDGGETWYDSSRTLIELSEQFESLRSAIITPNDCEGMLDGHAVCVTDARPGVAFYACRMGLFTTSDLGKSWRNHDVGRYAPYSYCRDLRIAVDDPKSFYLALSIASRSNAGSLWRSTDIGETWDRVDKSVTAKSTIMGINVHATDPNKVIYVTRGGQVIWTEDRCATWHEQQLPADAGDAFCCAVL